jgi:hypothetical protein
MRSWPYGAATLALAAVDILVIAVATTVCDLLTCLDGSDIPLAPLVVGDLRPLLASDQFAAAFPSCEHPMQMLAFGPAAGVAVIASLLVAAARRWPRLRDGSLLATLALLSGALPYAIGVLALRGNAVPEHSGRWLQWQLTGAALAAAVSLAFLAWGAWRRLASRGGSTVMPAAAVG